jgi:hypothetical protein
VLLVEALAETGGGEAVDEWRAAVSRWSEAIYRILRIYHQRGVLHDDSLELAAEELVDSVLGAYLDALFPGTKDVMADGEPGERIKAQVLITVSGAVHRLRAKP